MPTTPDWLEATDRMVSLVRNTGMTWRAAALLTLPDPIIAEVAATVLRGQHGEGRAPPVGYGPKP